MPIIIPGAFYADFLQALANKADDGRPIHMLVLIGDSAEVVGIVSTPDQAIDLAKPHYPEWSRGKLRADIDDDSVFAVENGASANCPCWRVYVNRLEQ
jgi:hypothetical protein